MLQGTYFQQLYAEIHFLHLSLRGSHHSQMTWKGEKKWVTKRGFATKREATQYERDFLMKQDGNVDMTFADFVEVYQRDRHPRIRESTIVMKENRKA